MNCLVGSSTWFYFMVFRVLHILFIPIHLFLSCWCNSMCPTDLLLFFFPAKTTNVFHCQYCESASSCETISWSKAIQEWVAEAKHSVHVLSLASLKQFFYHSFFFPCIHGSSWKSKMSFHFIRMTLAMISRKTTLHRRVKGGRQDKVWVFNNCCKAL